MGHASYPVQPRLRCTGPSGGCHKYHGEHAVARSCSREEMPKGPRHTTPPLSGYKTANKPVDWERKPVPNQHQNRGKKNAARIDTGASANFIRPKFLPWSSVVRSTGTTVDLTHHYHLLIPSGQAELCWSLDLIFGAEDFHVLSSLNEDYGLVFSWATCNRRSSGMHPA